MAWLRGHQGASGVSGQGLDGTLPDHTGEPDREPWGQGGGVSPALGCRLPLPGIASPRMGFLLASDVVAGQACGCCQGCVRKARTGMRAGGAGEVEEGESGGRIQGSVDASV